MPLMNTVAAPIATGCGTPYSFTHGAIDIVAMAAGLKLMKTSGEPMTIAPVGGPIDAPPTYSPASAPPATPPAIIAPAATAARPPVATMATARTGPSAAPMSSPLMALLWAISSPTRADGVPISRRRRLAAGPGRR